MHGKGTSRPGVIHKKTRGFCKRRTPAAFSGDIDQETDWTRDVEARGIQDEEQNSRTNTLGSPVRKKVKGSNWEGKKNIPVI